MELFVSAYQYKIHCLVAPRTTPNAVSETHTTVSRPDNSR